MTCKRSRRFASSGHVNLILVIVGQWHVQQFTYCAVANREQGTRSDKAASPRELSPITRRAADDGRFFVTKSQITDGPMRTLLDHGQV